MFTLHSSTIVVGLLQRGRLPPSYFTRIFSCGKQEFTLRKEKYASRIDVSFAH